MHSYFISYWATGRITKSDQSGQTIAWESVVLLTKPVGEKADLQTIKAQLVTELADIGWDVLPADIHLITVQHLHSRPSGASAP